VNLGRIELSLNGEEQRGKGGWEGVDMFKYEFRFLSRLCAVVLAVTGAVTLN
jgi:hypothetical protein